MGTMRGKGLQTVRRHGPIFCVLLILHSGIAFGAGDGQESQLLQEILAAWQSRQNSIRTLQYRCDLVQTITDEGPGSLDPYANNTSRPTEAVATRNSVVFSLSSDKIAYSKEGETWDMFRRVKQASSYRKVFDGTSDKSLSEIAPFPMGEVVSHGEGRSKLMHDVELIPFWIPTHTLMILEEIGFSLSRARVEKADAYYDGRKCVRVSFASEQTTARRKCFIHADRRREWLPLLYEEYVNGVIQFQAVFRYTGDDQRGWRLAGIRSDSFRDSTPQFAWSYVVTLASLNDPLDERLFSLTFPKGTQVAEAASIFPEASNSNVRYYLELGNGRQRPLDEAKYGRRIVSRRGFLDRGLSLLLSSVFLGVVLILYWTMRRVRARG